MEPAIFLLAGLAIAVAFSVGVLRVRRSRTTQQDLFTQWQGREIRVGYAFPETSVSPVHERRGIVSRVNRSSVWLRSTDAVDDTEDELELSRVRWARFPNGDEHRW